MSVVPGVSRRRALTGAATLGLTLPVLAACGSSSDGTAADPVSIDPSTPAPSETSTSAAPSDDPTTSATTSAAAANALVAASDVPVGGGVVLAAQQLVVTQPKAGEFKCFTAVCTHTGCLVNAVTTTINCPCHGSQYDITTGAVVTGPAPSPLAETAIKVDGKEIELA